MIVLFGQKPYYRPRRRFCSQQNHIIRYRPATLDIGATEEFVRYKRGEVAPIYNFGTYEATKNTFGLLVYQEQFMSIAHTLGGFDLGKTDYLRKAMGKKNHETSHWN